MADEDEAEIDICALRKRLRDEHAFVNKQKRDLQKEYTSIVSNGDSLLRGLWIAGLQWSNLNRLRGGAKFASECTYTSNLLDSIQFQDGYTQVGFKEVKYGNFLRELRENTDIFKSILILADRMKIETSAFLRSMAASIYGSCLFPGDQKALLMVVRSIIQYHLVYSERPLDIYKQDKNSFANLLNVLFQASLPCRAFLVLACREVVFDILLDGSLYWTLEEQELLSVMAVQEVRKKFGEPGSKGTPERIKDHMMRCWVALADAVYALLKKINKSLLCLPDELLWIVSCFYKFALERGFTDTQAKQIVMRFFFHQVIAPMLLWPQPFLIDTEIRASRAANFNLKKVTLIMQTLVSIEAGDDVSHLSREARQFFENLDKNPLHEVVNNLIEQLPKDGDVTLSDKDGMPGIARTSVLITKTDLDSLVSLLCHLKHISDVPQPTSTISKSNAQKFINRSSLEKVLNHLDGIHSVTSSMAKLSFTTEDANVQNELQNALKAFNKPLNEKEIVLVISLGVATIDCPGMLPEEKVLGMPTPKPKRKSTIQEAVMNHVNEMNENSQASDSESNESSSDEKLPEASENPEDVDSAEDVLHGFEDSFVNFAPKSQPFKPPTTNPFAENKDPFSDFDSILTVVDENDPFTSVITRFPEQPAPINEATVARDFAPPASVPSEFPPPVSKPSALVSPSSSTPLSPLSSNPSSQLSSSNNQGPLIDLGDLESFSSPDARINGTGSVTPESFLNSSGSQSSNRSDKRFSSSASSGSDTGIKRHSLPAKIQQSTHSSKKDKKGKDSVVRRKSLKNLQNAISNTVISPKRDKLKAKGSTLFNKRRLKKKNSERLLDSHDVATIIAASSESEKTPRVICDEIMQKYVGIKKDRPHINQSDITLAKTRVTRDEDEIMQDAKNKLRIVLSNGSAPVFPTGANVCNSGRKSEKAGRSLLRYLQQDLADAITSQDCTMIARLHETLSTLEKLSALKYPEVLKQLQQDYLTRKAYLSYLVRAHQGLVSTRQFLEKALERNEREREICRRYFMTQCVGMYMTKQKEKLDLFVAKFNTLQIPDEKSEEMKSFIQRLKEEFQRDPMWLGSNEQQQAEAVDALERQVISRVYSTAVYAFGETDRFRDDVFHENVQSLCNIIGEDFTLLEIKEEFQHEAPWYPAQYELFALSAYKTPKDKLQCIQRCCTTIMSLLGMSSGDAVGADAFTPVLIYVVVHANPRGLLTTIDFINNYLNETLTGEQYYCWMQFCSAIQFIKILLEENKSKLNYSFS